MKHLVNLIPIVVLTIILALEAVSSPSQSVAAFNEGEMFQGQRSLAENTTRAGTSLDHPLAIQVARGFTDATIGNIMMVSGIQRASFMSSGFVANLSRVELTSSGFDR